MAVIPAWNLDETTRAATKFNPLFGNPLKTRADVAKAVRDLIRPLLQHMSENSARIRLGAGGVHYGSQAAELEAFARPLWGLAPLLAGEFADGEEEKDWVKLWARGLAAGTDPANPEYWGDVGPYDQRMVEMAGLSLAILLSPETFWFSMPKEVQDRAARWMRTINDHPTADNNWLFFRVLTNLALRTVGQEWSEEAGRAALDRIDEFHLDDGYYRDGKWYQLDYYTPMGMHFYGLLIAKLAPDVFPDHAQRYRERAQAFAQDFQHWFADDGAAVPFGRSMTYRFAQGAFWSAAAFADEEVLPWGRIKGLVLRHLRWWANCPIAERDGILSIGYGYSNLLMSEAYNAPGSPYWALKIFLILAMDEDHPFWATEEEATEALPGGRIFSERGGFLARRGNGDALVLTGGQDGREHRYCDAKYARFAYSSAFTFSVASDAWGNRPERAAIDCGIAVTRDGTQWLTRSVITEAGVDAGMVWGVWSPDQNLKIETWLDFGPPGWHIRLHRITTDQSLMLSEGGFAVDRTGDGHMTPSQWIDESAGSAQVRSLSAFSLIRDLSGQREGTVLRAAPNTNLRFPRTFFPRLSGEFPSGVSWVATAVFAVPDPQAILEPLHLPQTITALCERKGVNTSYWRLSGR